MEMHKTWKCKVIKMSLFTLRIPTCDFGLKIGSRGTPWNSKSAQPGGSDFAKCQKVPFKWHFGHFGVFHIFDVFSLFLILILSIFDHFNFVTFSLFHVFLIFMFLMFCKFWWFLSLFYVCVSFVSLFVTNLGASMMTHFSPSITALPLSPFLVVKLWPIFDH